MRSSPSHGAHDLSAATAPVADWVRSRREIPSVSLFPKGRIFVFGLLARSYSRNFQNHVLGVNLNAPWVKRVLGGLFQTALRSPFSSIRDLRQVPQLWIPSTAHGVRLRVVAHDIELGRDQGLLWTQDGHLHYEGLETRFAVGKADLLRIELCDATNDPHFVIVRTPGGYLALRILPLNVAGHAELRHTLQEWSDSSTHSPSELLPPIGIQRRKRSYLLRQTLKRARPACAVLAGSILTDTFAARWGASDSLRYRIDAAVAVAAVHLLFLTYQKVRYEEELAVRNYRPFAQPPVVAPVERTAADLSVGVRLNAL